MYFIEDNKTNVYLRLYYIKTKQQSKHLVRLIHSDAYSSYIGHVYFQTNY